MFRRLTTISSITVQNYLPVYSIVAELTAKEKLVSKFIAEVMLLDAAFFQYRPSLRLCIMLGR